MKRVPLNEYGDLNARTVIATMLEEASGPQGITYGEMRKRDRVLTKLQASANGYFDLEDADYDVLRRIVDIFQFRFSRRELLAVLDDIVNARAPDEK